MMYPNEATLPSARKLLTCACPAGVNGELSMILSMAEAWVAEGKNDFDLFLYCLVTDLSEEGAREEISKKLSAFESRIVALNSFGISLDVAFPLRWGEIGTLAYNADVRSTAKTDYSLAVLYPCPAFGDSFVSIYYRFLRKKCADLPDENFLHTEGMANLKSTDGFKKAFPKSKFLVDRSDVSVLELMQPPCVIESSHFLPSFVSKEGGFINYYLIYTNPDLLKKDKSGFDFVGPDYEDSFNIFIRHGLAKKPSDNIQIFYNKVKSSEIHDFVAIANSLLAKYPHLIIEVETTEGIKTVKADDALTATGPTVYINTQPKCSNLEFVGLINYAQIAVMNSSGCFDEALSLEKPVFILDNLIMKRIENILKIIDIEQISNPASLRTLKVFLEAHQELKMTVGSKESVYEKLTNYFLDPALHEALAEDFKQLKSLISSKYRLSVAFYNAVSEFESHVDLKQIRLNAELHSAVEANLTEQVLSLLAEGAVVTPNYRTGKSILNCAIEHGNIRVVEALLDLVKDFDDTAYVYRSPLEIAVLKGNAHILRILLERGCDEDINIEIYDSLDNQVSLLRFAIAQDNREVVAVLLSQPTLKMTGEDRMAIHAKWGESFLTKNTALHAPEGEVYKVAHTLTNAGAAAGAAPVDIALLGW